MAEIPNAEQLQALITWAQAHGRYWKAKLGDAWMKAGEGVPGYNPHLQQVRNEFGPTWLYTVSLPQLKAWHDAATSTTPCDECGAAIPDAASSEVNAAHESSCSLYPEDKS